MSTAPEGEPPVSAKPLFVEDTKKVAALIERHPSSTDYLIVTVERESGKCGVAFLATATSLREMADIVLQKAVSKFEKRIEECSCEICVGRLESLRQALACVRRNPTTGMH